MPRATLRITIDVADSDARGYCRIREIAETIGAKIHSETMICRDCQALVDPQGFCNACGHMVDVPCKACGVETKYDLLDAHWDCPRCAQNMEQAGARLETAIIEAQGEYDAYACHDRCRVCGKVVPGCAGECGCDNQ